MTGRSRRIPVTRRRVLGAGLLAAPAILLGHRGLSGPSTPGDALDLPLSERMSYRMHRLIVGDALAREYAPSRISARFPVNGSRAPSDPAVLSHAKRGFRAWRLGVGGLCDCPAFLALDELRAMPARTQITRHDCVEGWSAIAQWTGVPLAALLDRVGLMPQARYIVFHCADDLLGTPYYESIDLVDARHPQTILAYAMNGAPLPLEYGAPLRLRVERQLGYKHAKFITRIEAVASLAGIHGGRGGFWEDYEGYEWYAGI